MSSQLGNTQTPNYANFWYGLNVQNQFWSTYTSPSSSGILIQTIHAYFDLNQSGPATAYLCVWQGATGALLANVAVGGIGTGNHNIGGQHWHSANLATPLFVAASTPLSIGAQVNQANGMTFSTLQSGNTGVGTNATTPGSIAGATGLGTGYSGSYVDYVPAGAYAFDGSAWQSSSIYVFDGSAWQPASGVFVFDGSVWQPAQ